MKRSGFTLVELVVTMAVFAILVTVALPGFSSFIREYTATSAMMGLHKDLQLARSEAVSLGKRVTVCHLNSSNACTNDWLNGVTVFVDDGANIGSYDNGELKLVESNPIGKEHSFKASRTRITFRSDGMSAGFTDTFIFCPKGGNQEHYRGITISGTGVTRASADTNGDGVHEKSDGTPLTCS